MSRAVAAVIRLARCMSYGRQPAGKERWRGEWRSENLGMDYAYIKAEEDALRIVIGTATLYTYGRYSALQ